MGDAGTSFLLQQLGYQSPVMLVYVVGAALALAFFRRAAAPAVLCLLGCGLLLLTTVAVAAVQAALVQQRGAEGMPVEQYARAMSAVSLAGSVARAVGLGLVVAAVFVGRRRPALDGTGVRATIA